MPKLKIFFILVLSISSLSLGAQSWTKKYVLDGAQYVNCQAVQWAENGSIFIAGRDNSKSPYSSFIIKTNAAGRIQWAKRYSREKSLKQSFWIHDIKITREGGLIMAAQASSRLLIAVTNDRGRIKWAKKFVLGEGFDNGAVIETDQGFMVTATKAEYFQEREACVLLLDKEGNFEWFKSYREPDRLYIRESMGIEQVNENEFVLWGRSFRADRTDADNSLYMTFMIGIDQKGEVLWSRLYKNDYLSPKLIFTPEKEILICGTIDYSTNKQSKKWLGLMKIDQTGEVVWAKEIDNQLEKRQIDHDKALGLSGDNIVMGGRIDGSEIVQSNSFLLILDRDGHILASKTYNMSDHYEGVSGLAQDKNKNILLSGTFSDQYHGVYLVRTANNLCGDELSLNSTDVTVTHISPETSSFSMTGGEVAKIEEEKIHFLVR